MQRWQDMFDSTLSPVLISLVWGLKSMYSEKNKLAKIESNGYFGASENTEPEIAFRYWFLWTKAQGYMYIFSIAWDDTNVLFQCGQTLLLTGADPGGGCRGCAPPPEIKSSSYSLLKFVYVTGQWRHSLEVQPLLRKILDPPFIDNKRRKKVPLVLSCQWSMQCIASTEC